MPTTCGCEMKDGKVHKACGAHFQWRSAQVDNEHKRWMDGQKRFLAKMTDALLDGKSGPATRVLNAVSMIRDKVGL